MPTLGLKGHDPPQVPRGTATVTVFVGPDKTEYVVHKQLLCASSSFFCAAFEKDFQETTTGCITLPEEDSDQIQTFLDWLYSGRPSIVRWPAVAVRPGSFADAAWWSMLLMADRLLIPGFKLFAWAQVKRTIESQGTQGLAIFPTDEFLHMVFENEGIDENFMTGARQYAVQQCIALLRKGKRQSFFHLQCRTVPGFGAEAAIQMSTHLTYCPSEPREAVLAQFIFAPELNLAELEARARAADSHPVPSTSSSSSSSESETSGSSGSPSDNDSTASREASPSLF